MFTNGLKYLEDKIFIIVQILAIKSVFFSKTRENIEFGNLTILYLPKMFEWLSISK